MLGHSEGCIIAPQVSAMRPSIAGLILLCPFIDDMEAILLRQAMQIEEEFKSLAGVGGALKRILPRLMGMTVASQRQLIHRLKSSS